MRCTTFPAVSTDGAHVLLIYCIFINILHIAVERLYFSADICLMKYVQCGPRDTGGFKSPTLGRWQEWEKPVGVSVCVCVCMTALNVMQGVQFGNVCLLSSTSYEGTWSWMCTKHCGRNFITTVARWIWSLDRWNSYLKLSRKRKSQVLEELQTGEHEACESSAWAKSK